MQKYTDIILGFFLGIGAYGLSKLKSEISVGDLATVGTTFIAWKAYNQWKIDKLVQLHINLRTQKYLYLDKINCETSLVYALDYLNELELIADMILRKKISFDLAEEHFKTWYSIVEEESWMNIIRDQQKNDSSAYRKLLAVAEKFKIKQNNTDKKE